jgi:hypothetical protein
MNMANSQYNEQEFEYQVDNDRRGGKEKARPQRRAQYAQANRPAVHNGIHRRRNKRFAW